MDVIENQTPISQNPKSPKTKTKIWEEKRKRINEKPISENEKYRRRLRNEKRIKDMAKFCQNESSRWRLKDIAFCDKTDYSERGFM